MISMRFPRMRATSWNSSGWTALIRPSRLLCRSRSKRRQPRNSVSVAESSFSESGGGYRGRRRGGLPTDQTSSRRPHAKLHWVRLVAPAGYRVLTLRPALGFGDHTSHRSFLQLPSTLWRGEKAHKPLEQCVRSRSLDHGPVQLGGGLFRMLRPLPESGPSSET